ncbi:hypothetical protein K435DRAFT_326810 [Dendrothele bispora CBS 962.96]|uniref:Uncharacterized protein n=1 Tax=Dendrothele bispora (strain CBS 962.96) TaxID=1314807 RepID=A0A4S8LH08_DENBC|nr:hypothetical protein K435DRAFT_326810 [Dendrothele bispora CBS 962.96]
MNTRYQLSRTTLYYTIVHSTKLYMVRRLRLANLLLSLHLLLPDLHTCTPRSAGTRIMSLEEELAQVKVGEKNQLLA